MAQDIFAPKSSFDIAFERPQEPVKDNTAKIRSDFQAMALNSQARAIQGQTQYESAVFKGLNAGLSIASDGLQAKRNMQEKGTISALEKEIDDIDQEGESPRGLTYEARRTRINEAVQKAANNLPGGYRDLAKYDTVLKAKTGLSLKQIATSPEQEMQEAMMKDPVFITAYQASRILEPNLTEQQRFSYAQNAAAENAAVTLMQTTANVNDLSSYYAKTKPLINNQMKNLHTAVVAAISIKKDSGQPITPTDIENLEVGIAEAKLIMEMAVPNTAPQEERDNVTEFFSNLNNFMTQIKESKNPDNITNGIVSSLVQGSQNFGEAIAFANIASIEMLTSTAGIDIMKTATKKLSDGGSTAAISSLGNLDTIFNDILSNKPDEVVGPNTILSPEEMGALFDTTNMTAEDLLTERQTGLGLLKELEVGAVATDLGRRQLVAGVASVVKSLNHLDFHQTGSQIKELVEDSGLLEKINMLESVDKPAANQIRTLLNSAITNNLRFAESTLSSIESGAKGIYGYKLGLEWDEATKTYYATASDFIRAVQREIGSEAPATNSKGMPLVKGTYLGTFGDIEKAYKYRTVIEQTNSLLDKTLVDGVDTNQETIIQGTRLEPIVVENEEAVGLVAEGQWYSLDGVVKPKPYTIQGETDDEQQAFFDSLAPGSVFINPSDGRLLTKPEPEFQ